jgi:microcystin-dependent protein
MSQPYIGEIRPFGFDFAPRGWAICQGQVMSIAQNQALFAILGTTYGGNGVQTFALPDLRGRTPIHWGNNAGNSYVLGQSSGVESVTLLASQLPSHTHSVMASADLSAAVSPAGNVMGAKPRGGADVYAAGTNPTALSAASVGPLTATGGAHENMQPSLTLNFCIALNGIFPSRN